MIAFDILSKMVTMPFRTLKIILGIFVMDGDAKELREQILDLVLSVYHTAAAANGWTTPPKDIEHTMDEIFRLVTIGLKITE
jgi:hypothetical protein